MKCMAITTAGLAELEAREAAFEALTDEQREKFVRARVAARAKEPPPARPAPQAAAVTSTRTQPRSIAAPTTKTITKEKPPMNHDLKAKLAQHGIGVAEPPRGISTADRERVDRVMGRRSPSTGVRNEGFRLVLGVSADEDNTSPPPAPKAKGDLEKRVAELEKRVAELEGKTSDNDDDDAKATRARPSSKLNVEDRARIDRAFGLGGAGSEVRREGARLVLGASMGGR